MAPIIVTVRSDNGDLGIHFKHGELTPGRKLIIEEEEFSAELFERPSPDYRSPHEKTDQSRAEELKQSVGVHIYEKSAPLPAAAPDKPKKAAAAAQEG